MRVEELKLEKVKKSSKTAEKVSFTLEIILIVATVLCMAASIFSYVNRADIDKEMQARIENKGEEVTEAFDKIKNLDYEVGGVVVLSFDPSDNIENGEYGEYAAKGCALAALVCIMVSIIFAFVRRIFKTINAAETPFEESVIKKIKGLFITVCIVLLIAVGIFAAGAAALLCWGIYTILDYGYVIQKQVDETL